MRRLSELFAGTVLCLFCGVLSEALGSSPPAGTEPPEASPETAPQTIHASFQCDDGKSVEATFDNTGSGSVDLRLSDGREWVLPQALSASGARYANADESIVFWNKGNTAFIEEAGQQTYSGCTTVP